MFAEAIFWGDTVQKARSRKLYWLCAAYIGLLSPAAIVMWVAETKLGAGVSSFAGAVFVRGVLHLQCLAAVLVSASWTASALVEEKRRNTYWTLFLSRLSTIEIVFGKLLSRIFHLFVVLLLGVPVVVLVMDFGALTFAELGAGTVCIVASLLLGGGVGILFSAISRQLYAAVVGSYVTLGLLGWGAWWGAPQVRGVLWQYLPNFALQTLFDAIPGAWPEVWTSFTACGLTCLALGTVAVFAMRRFSPGSAARRARWSRFRWGALFDKLFPRIWRFGFLDPDGDKDHPISWRESAFSSAGMHGLAKMIFCFAMVAACVMAMCWRGVRGDQASLWVLGAALMFLFVHTAAMASLTVAREREQGTLDMLLMLPVEPPDIVAAQFRGVLHGLVLPFGFFTLYSLVLGIVWRASPFAIALFPALLWAGLRFYAAAGMAVSAGRTTTAAALAVGLPLAALFTLGMLSLGAWVLFFSFGFSWREFTEPSQVSRWWLEAIEAAAAGLIWWLLAAMATNRIFREVSYKFDRIVYDR